MQYFISLLIFVPCSDYHKGSKKWLDLFIEPDYIWKFSPKCMFELRSF